MLRKITLAFVAAASLSAMALVPTAASAHWRGGFGGFHGFHHHHHWGRGWGPGFGIGTGIGLGLLANGFGGEECYAPRRVPTPFGFRWRTINVCEY